MNNMFIFLAGYGSMKVWCTFIICITVIVGLYLLSNSIIQLINSLLKAKEERQNTLLNHEKEMKEMEWKHKMEWEKEQWEHTEKTNN